MALRTLLAITVFFLLGKSASVKDVFEDNRLADSDFNGELGRDVGCDELKLRQMNENGIRLICY